MSVLVVGGSGYLGAAVCQALERDGYDTVAFSRSGARTATRVLRGDVTRHNLGLSPGELEQVQGETTHIVSVFGSVDWDSGPAEAVDLHAAGIGQLLRVARDCEQLVGLVHVSSLLALGRATGRVGNRELYVGQRFRNWYEYGKYYSETLVRAASDVPTTVVRLGPVLGPDPTGAALRAQHGLLAAVPPLLQGYPLHLSRGGRFPCYVGEVSSAAALVVRAVSHPATGATWSWFDPEQPSLAAVLHALCRPWGVVPRIVESRMVRRLQPALAARSGVPKSLLDYTTPWFDVDAGVLAEIPGGPPACPTGYLDATGHALKDPRCDTTGVW